MTDGAHEDGDASEDRRETALNDEKKRPNEVENHVGKRGSVVGMAEAVSEFNRARKIFSERYPQDLFANSHPFFHGSIASEAQMKRLRDPDRDHRHFTQSFGRKLINFIDNPDPVLGSVYHQIGALIGQTSEDKQSVVNYFTGQYRYFRMHARNGSAKSARFSFGDVEIKTDDGDPVFEHRSGDYINDFDSPERCAPTEPENRGFVFYSGASLYLFGQRAGVLRLAIVQEFSIDGAETSPAGTKLLRGIILSRRRSVADPFAARFLMVDRADAAMMEKLEGAGGEKFFHARWADKRSYMLLDEKAKLFGGLASNRQAKKISD